MHNSENDYFEFYKLNPSIQMYVTNYKELLDEQMHNLIMSDDSFLNINFQEKENSNQFDTVCENWYSTFTCTDKKCTKVHNLNENKKAQIETKISKRKKSKIKEGSKQKNVK